MLSTSLDPISTTLHFHLPPYHQWFGINIPNRSAPLYQELSLVSLNHGIHVQPVLEIQLEFIMQFGLHVVNS